MRFFTSACLLAISGVIHAADSSVLIHRPASFRLGFENITLPGNEKMGMVGGSYLLETLPNLYLGPAAYGAISGKRGGFFTGGGEVAYRLPLANELELETGFYVGGGGGGAADSVGGGLMLRPHIDLLWNFGSIRAGISASSVRYPNGSIRSNQLGAVVSYETDFIHTSASRVGQSMPFRERSGIGFDRIAVLGNVYQPRPGMTDNTGKPTTRKIGLAGFRTEQFLSNDWIWGIEAGGATSGGADGYAEVLGTLAWEKPLIGHSVYGGIRGSFGMGGGGNVATGGGALAKAGVYGTVLLSRDLYLSAEAGYATAPDGEFRSRYAALHLGVILDRPVFQANLDATSFIQGWEWSGSVQHYVQAARRDGSYRDLKTIGFKMDRDLEHGLYLSGQAHSAMTGAAGGYSVGLFGMGWKTPTTSFGLSAGAELMLGASGGGGVLTEGGALAQPMIYAKQDLGHGWSARVGAGKVRAFKGGLNSTVYDVSLGYSFGLPVH
ncbi:MAG: hypothetical protein H6R07_2557 [Proteobacteria bacterium]|nr:hypothetical protein [Pseudomonadota bacterium]